MILSFFDKVNRHFVVSMVFYAQILTPKNKFGIPIFVIL
ncbi:hypothetical protein MHA_0478 [Mannheimia haemolytica PHL213]|nr:hypothetical protein MHA_0478 [Mannheimia haemolytica PHL213]